MHAPQQARLKQAVDRDSRSACHKRPAHMVEAACVSAYHAYCSMTRVSCDKYHAAGGWALTCIPSQSYSMLLIQSVPHDSAYPFSRHRQRPTAHRICRLASSHHHLWQTTTCGRNCMQLRAFCVVDIADIMYHEHQDRKLRSSKHVQQLPHV